VWVCVGVVMGFSCVFGDDTVNGVGGLSVPGRLFQVWGCEKRGKKLRWVWWKITTLFNDLLTFKINSKTSSLLFSKSYGRKIPQ
jgi:hypothetical protein